MDQSLAARFIRISTTHRGSDEHTGNSVDPVSRGSTRDGALPLVGGQMGSDRRRHLLASLGDGSLDQCAWDPYPFWITSVQAGASRFRTCTIGCRTFDRSAR